MSNRLGTEASPYLLQHKDNPVDWFPWGPEAFARARDEDKPIFLSIGYSTCHWCHVMEHESFEDAHVAAVLNEHFVSIKVDREERPDVDRVYMTFVQATTGSGGWPMSVWLTPSLEPFYGGTYFPPSARWGKPGFVDVLQEIARIWREERDSALAAATDIVARLREHGGGASGAGIPGAEALDQAVREFAATFDRHRGGFGTSPKFPRPSELLFLLREHARTGAGEPREMVLLTLRAMAFGGMRDHIGGGFHRYSVDAEWRVPHFEKMLYDQAQLVLAYLEAAQVAGEQFYADVALDTLEYVRRDLTHPEGGFYSAEDADSVPPDVEADLQVGPKPHKTEGAFYLWRDEEIGQLLGADAAPFRLRFGIKADGNAPFDPQHEFTKRNLLYTARPIDSIAAETGLTLEQVAAALDRARHVLFEARARRPRPHLDDKVLTAWNGLMIAAFARAARAVDGAEGCLDDARRAALFVRRHLWREADGTLLRRYRDGNASKERRQGVPVDMVDGYAEDYAYLIFGLLELFQADGDPRWLAWALTLQRRQDELFWDPAEGGWFSTTGRDPTVLLRLKEDYDGAEPAASSVSVLNLLTLSHLTADPDMTARVERTFGHFGPRLTQTGRAVPMMLAALSVHHTGMTQIVITGDAADGAARELSDVIRFRYLPASVVVPIAPASQPAIAQLLPWTAAMTSRDGRPAAYVCRDFTCQMPAVAASELEAQLQ